MTKSMLFANHRVVGTVLMAVLWSAVVQHALHVPGYTRNAPSTVGVPPAIVHVWI
jgi:hypothetical protein